jgi:hypothetical protein
MAGTIERKKITVTTVGEVRTWGDKKLPIVKFKAKDGEKEYSYEIFGSQDLINAVKPGPLECDVETSTREKDGDTFTDRKIKQIYIGGEPIARKGPAGGGKSWGDSPEKIASIENMACMKGVFDLRIGGALNDNSPEYKAALAWANGHFGQCAKKEPVSSTSSDVAFDALESAGKNENPISIDQRGDLVKSIKESGRTVEEVGALIKNKWKWEDVKNTSDLKVWQYEIIKKYLKDATK